MSRGSQQTHRLECEVWNGNRRLGAVSGPEAALRRSIHPMWMAKPVLFVVLMAMFAASRLPAQTPFLVKHLSPSDPDATVRGLAAVGDQLFFLLHDREETLELWKSDASFAGTMPIRSFEYDAAYFQVHGRVSALGDLAIFTASDGIHGFELWRSDGTPEGTVMIKDIDPEGSGIPTIVARRPVQVFGGFLYFCAQRPEEGIGLWRTDGTEEGTILVQDFDFTFGQFPLPAEYMPTNLGMFLSSTYADFGTELSFNDGSPPGSDPIRDIWPNAGSSFPQHFRRWGNTIYLQAHDGEHGSELWRSDGSTNGTVLVKDIRPGEPTDGSAIGSAPELIINLGNLMYLTADDGVHGRELWKSDSTTNGTVLVKDISPDPANSGPERAQTIGDILYFTADDGPHGRELWRSDGTTAGTQMIKDISIDPDNTGPAGTVAIGNHIYFNAYLPSTGRELWKSNGTLGGTVLMADLNAGTLDSNPNAFTCAGDYVFFIADSPSGFGVYLYAFLKPSSPYNGRLINISTRGHVGISDSVEIGGFVIEGTRPKTVVIRGRGPSLADLGVDDVLLDPSITLFSGPSPLAVSDNWQDGGQVEAIQEVGLAPPDSQESAILRRLDPGAYTAILSGSNGTTGNGIIEIFDVDPPGFPSHLVNISTRGFVSTGDGVMIGGFIIEGPAARSVLLRARGPSLESSGISGTLADPYLRLFSGGTQVDFNDDWQEGSQAADISVSGLAPSDSREAALLRTLSPGAYTLIVEGVDGTVGIGIVEAFDVTKE